MDDTPNKTSEGSFSTGPPSNFKQIEAFKTITMMLSMLSHSTSIDVHDNLNKEEITDLTIQDPFDRQETRMLDAFAQLAVGEYDVAALATNRVSTDGITLRIISCVVDFPTERSLSATTPSKDLETNVLTKNCLPDVVSSPQVLKPSRPEGAEGMKPLEYMEKLNIRWIRPSLAHHLWTLSNVLTGPDGQHDIRFWSDLLPNLWRYMAAISYKKIAHRFGNEYHSLPYIIALKTVTDVLPTLPPPIDRFSNNNSSDVHFLSDFVLPYAESLQPETLLKLTTKFPNLIAKAVGMKKSPSQQRCQLYTDATRTEFHQLLLELLELFQTALEALTSMDEEVANSSDNGAKQFADNVRNVDLIGYALLRIAKGRAFRMHLESIESYLSLNDPRIRAGQASSECIEAFPALQPVRSSDSDGMEATKLLSQSYVDWLRWVLDQFDAIETLVTYMTSSRFPYRSISLSLLAVPKTTDTFLPWLQLFSGNEFIPALTGINPVFGSLTNESILLFLEKGIDEDKGAQHAKILSLELESHPTIENLRKLTMITYLGIGTKANTILEKIGDSCIISDSIRDEMKAIRKLFNKLPTREQFFCDLAKMTTFKGTVHCEACLASLLPAFTEHLTPQDLEYYKDINIFADMQGFGRVIGLSAPSCPSCAIYLQMLASMSGSPSEIITRGNHGVISACSLPAWTPDRIVKAMNTSLGLLLRQGLISLMDQETDCIWD
ncbi:hypothetical protein BDN70DRAFT_936560 [Pholiota conissans]|uniref:Uncharacterized protein n=1 Tax=Pholiota conissans TaxID=109636 RepID=A0A9P5YTP6_9AGAR|nr:hypothetical protein BDN70DRAFT_936560 [Pholiota conissans]